MEARSTIRVVTDLPWPGVQVYLLLGERRFFRRAKFKGLE